jgi:hypothetical protein
VKIKKLFLVRFSDNPSISQDSSFDEADVQKTMSLTMDMNLTDGAYSEFSRVNNPIFFLPEETSTPNPILNLVSVDNMYS